MSKKINKEDFVVINFKNWGKFRFKQVFVGDKNNKSEAIDNLRVTRLIACPLDCEPPQFVGQTGETSWKYAWGHKSCLTENENTREDRIFNTFMESFGDRVYDY